MPGLPVCWVMVTLLLLSSSTLHVNAVSLAQYDLWPLGMPIKWPHRHQSTKRFYSTELENFLTFLVLIEIFNGKCPLNYSMILLDCYWKSLLDDPVVTPLLEGISPGCRAASEEYVSLLTEGLFSPDTELTEDHRQTCEPCLTMLYNTSRRLLLKPSHFIFYSI